MTKHEVNVGDGVEFDDQVGGDVEPVIERAEYVVLAEAGLFKNGVHYPQGDRVPLIPDAPSTRAFLGSGEVKPA